MTYRNLKKLLDPLDEEQLNQDVAIAVMNEGGLEVYQRDIGFANPNIPCGPLFDDVEDCILDPNHCYFALII